MISLLRSGVYKLVETKHHTKILSFDSAVFAWLEPAGIGEILVASYKKHKADCVLSVGRYNLYDVDDEPHLSDQQHLELDAGMDNWQGYLLPTGLPDSSKKRSRIIPTGEVITHNPDIVNIEHARG